MVECSVQIDVTKLPRVVLLSTNRPNRITMLLFVSTKISEIPENLLVSLLVCLLSLGCLNPLWAQPGGGGGLGCLIDAGISPQEVCLNDHVFLGGNPTIPTALSSEVASLEWIVVAGGADVSFVPSPYVPNPQVYITESTTFQVTMVLNDGSMCTSQTTLHPISAPTLTIPESIVHCDGSTTVQFFNATPSNSVYITYDIDWGDNEIETDLTWASTFQHTYDVEGSYDVQVHANLGMCSNIDSVNVFVGTEPEPPTIIVPSSVCSASTLDILWSNLSEYPLSTGWGLSIEGNLEFMGVVNESTSDTLTWTFSEIENCLDVWGSVSLFAQAFNACSTTPSNANAEIQVELAPVAHAMVLGDSCGQITLSTGPETFCPELLDFSWEVLSEDEGASWLTVAGGPDQSLWIAVADTGQHEVVLHASNDGCGSHSDTISFCVEMPTPTHWSIGDMENGPALYRCIGDSLHLGIDSLTSVCGNEISLVWTVTALDTISDLASVSVTGSSGFDSWFGFSEVGHFLIELDGSAGCGEVSLHASVLVGEPPTLSLTSYNLGQVDSVLCIGEDVSVVADLDAYLLENGAYELNWGAFTNTGIPSNSVSFEEIGDSTLVVTALHADTVHIVLEINGACGTSTDTLTLYIEGAFDYNYQVIEGNEGPWTSNDPSFLQCLNDSLVIQYNAPWALEVNLASDVSDLVDVIQSNPSNIGTLHWLAAGDVVQFGIEYVSMEGCIYHDTLTFGSLNLPEIHVFDPSPLCAGESALFEAEVISGSTGLMTEFSWIGVSNSSESAALGFPIAVTAGPSFEAIPPCNAGLHIHAAVTDDNGCVGVTPEPASIFPDCPEPPMTQGTLLTCHAPGDTAAINLLGWPSGGTWMGASDVNVNNADSTAWIVTGNQNMVHTLTYLVESELGCPSSNDLCWIQAAQDSAGVCHAPEWCTDPSACNYNMVECGVTGCIFLDSLPVADAGHDVLQFCQSYQPVLLSPEAPYLGTWSGPGVFDNDGVWGNLAWLNVSQTGTWNIYFAGGIGECSTLDSIQIVVHPNPTHDHVGALAFCHESVVDFNFNAAGTGGVCWSFGWYDQPLPPCDQNTMWEMDGTGFIRWLVTDTLGCSSEMVFELTDWGGPNALAGPDTTFCLSGIPDVISAQYGTPMELGCAPSYGFWTGEGTSFESSANVATSGNCQETPVSWTDSVWVFTAPSLGEFELIWTVVDCHGCVDQDTMNIVVKEPTAPSIPDLHFCLNDPVGLISQEEGTCWQGAGIDQNYVFDPMVAGVGSHPWIVGLGEGSCAVSDTVVAIVSPNPLPHITTNMDFPCVDTPFDVCLDSTSANIENWVVQWYSYPDMNATESCEGLCCTMLNAQDGLVTAHVTDDNGCQGSDDVLVVLAWTDVVDVPDTIHMCADGQHHPLLGAFPANGTWSGDMIDEAGLFKATEEGLFEVTYTYITPPGGCISTGHSVVVVTSVPQPEISNPPFATCLHSIPILLTDDEGVWVGPGINADGSIFMAIPGDYTYHLVSGEGSCYASDSVVVTFLPLPSSDIVSFFDGNPTALCTDDPLAIEISEEYIEANDIVTGFVLGCDGIGGEFPNFTYLPESDCSISVVVVDANGCMALDMQNIFVPGPQPFDPGPPVVLCLGESVMLDDYIVPECNIESLNWAGTCVSAEGLVTASEVGLCPAQLSIPDCNQCMLMGEREVLVLDVPVVEIAWEDSVVCDGQEVDMAVAVYGGNLSYSWTWVDGDQIATPDTPWVAMNPGLSPISVSVSVTATNLCGSNSDESFITVNPSIEVLPTSNLGPTPLVDTLTCAPVEWTYLAEAPGATEWVWSDEFSVNDDAENQATWSIPAVDSVTVFTLSVQAGLPSSMCSNPLIWQVTVVPEPQAEITASMDHNCGLELTPGISSSFSHGTPEWAWTGGILPEAFPNDWTIDQEGLTTLTLTVHSDFPGSSCTAFDSVELSLFHQPVAGFVMESDVVMCAPGIFNLVDTSTDATSIEWYVDYQSGEIEPGSSLELGIPFAGEYGLVWVAQGQGGCSDSMFVDSLFLVLPSPDAGIWSNQPSFVPWSLEGTEFIFNDVSFGGDSTIWTIGDSTIIDEAILNFFYQDPGAYEVSQQVINEFGCEDSISFRFEIIDELSIHVPTAFTPNGDNLNDLWKPVIAGESRIQDYHLQVISRWGQIVFETHDPSQGWDALDVRRSGKLEDVQNSVFLFRLNVLPEATPLDPNPDWIEYKGHVMIVD